MRNRFAVLILIVLAVAVLSACGGTAATPTPGGGTLLGEDYEDALSLRNQLLLGTLRLQGTPDQMTAEQARTLLPLWQAFKALSASETSAPEETAAVLEQIQAALTHAQVGAITALKLTNADLTAWYAEQGIVVQPTPQPGVTPSGTPGAGKNSGLTQEQREATRAAAAAAGTTVAGGGTSGSARSTILIDKVIETLEQLGGK